MIVRSDSDCNRFNWYREMAKICRGSGDRSFACRRRRSTDLFDVLKQFSVFTRRDEIVFQRTGVELNAEFESRNELLFDLDQMQGFTFVRFRDLFLRMRRMRCRAMSNAARRNTYESVFAVGVRVALRSNARFASIALFGELSRNR